MISWGDVATWFTFALLGIVAFNQFGASRPSLQVEPNPHDQTLPPKFLLRVGNPTNVPVQIHRHWGTTTRPVPVDLTDEAAAWVLQENTFNLRIPTGKTAVLAFSVPEGEPLLLIIRWRRLSGLHLFQFFPLYTFLTRKRTETVWRMQTRVYTVD